MTKLFISIDIVSDFVCPWCYIGHQRLYNAAQQDQQPLEIRFLPYQLNPQLPTQGISRADYISQKFGQQAGSFYQRIDAIAQEDGLNLRFDLIEHQPNTFDLHRLMLAVQTHHPSIAEPLMLRVFQGCFEQGKRLDDTDYWAGLIAELGGEADLAETTLRGNAYRDEIITAQQQQTQSGITGVPFFVVHTPDGPKGIPGAIETEAWKSVFQQLATT